MSDSTKEKVVPLRGELPTKFGEPVEKVVSVLESLLAKAKTGQLRGIAFTTVETDFPATGWNYDGSVAVENALGMGILVLERRYVDNESKA